MRVPESLDTGAYLNGLGKFSLKKMLKKVKKALVKVPAIATPYKLITAPKRQALKKAHKQAAKAAARAATPVAPVAVPVPMPAEQYMPGDEYVTQPLTSQPPYAAPAGYNWVLANPGTASQQWTLVPAQQAAPYVQPAPSYPYPMPSYPPAQSYAPASSYYPSPSYQRPAAPSMAPEYGEEEGGEGGEEGAETWEDQAPSFEKRGIAPPSAPEEEYAEEGGEEGGYEEGGYEEGEETEEEMEGFETVKLASGEVGYFSAGDEKFVKVARKGGMKDRRRQRPAIPPARQKPVILPVLPQMLKPEMVIPQSAESWAKTEQVKLPSGKVKHRRKEGRSLMIVPIGFNEVAYHNGMGFIGLGLTSSEDNIARKLEDLVRLANRTMPTSRTAVANLMSTIQEISLEAKVTLPEPLNYSVSDQIDLGIVQHTDKWMKSSSPADWKKAWDSLRERATAIAGTIRSGQKPAGVQPVVTVIPAQPQAAPAARPAAFDWKKYVIPAVILAGAVVAFKTLGKGLGFSAVEPLGPGVCPPGYIYQRPKTVGRFMGKKLSRALRYPATCRESPRTYSGIRIR